MGRRLVVLIVAGVALAAVYVALHGVPGMRRSRGGGTDGGGQAKANSGAEAPAPPAEARAIQRYKQIQLLGEQRKVENLPTFRKELSNGDWRIEVAAVAAIGKLADKGDPKALVEVAAEPKRPERVRGEAIDWLGSMRYMDSGEAVLNALEDESLLVRTRASRAIRSIIGFDLGYRATDPPARRQQAVRKLRELWPVFYKCTVHPE